MNVFDIELIYSWTPSEYELLMQGVNHQVIDQYDFMAQTAMANRYAQNTKRASLNKIFDAKKARRRLEKGIEEEEAEIKRMVELNKVFQGFKPEFRAKGGN